MTSLSGLTLSRLLSHHARYRSDYPALDFGGRCWTFIELNNAANQLAHGLLSRGLKKGDQFATILPNSVELMLAYLAAAASGLVIVPCSVMLQSGGLKTLLEDSGAKLVICSHDQAGDLDQILPDLHQLDPRNRVLQGAASPDKTRPGWTSYSEFVANQPTSHPGIHVEADDVFNIMYSSGTTGLPKGIIHTHQIRCMYCTLFGAAWRMTPESVVLHAGALVFNGAMLDLMPWLYLGCHYVLHARFDPEAVIADIVRHRVTHLVMVPAQIIAILSSPAYTPQKLESVEMLHNVGAPLHLRYKQQINTELEGRFYELYGVTEGFMTILDKTESVRKAGSVGKPAAFNQVAILDQNGAACPAGEVGEICGKGPMVMPGYHNNPELTLAAFHGDWLRSGDLGYLDEDGYLFLVDRAKDMIISGGVNVYPKDIEEIVISHAAVSEVAVFGVENTKWGEVPVAAVTLRTAILPEEILQWVNQRVDARFQRLQKVIVLDSFPRNVAGKILKRELRQQYGGAS